MKLGVYACWRGHSTTIRADEATVRQTKALPCKTCQELAHLTDVMDLGGLAEAKPRPRGWSIVDGGKA